MAMRLLLVEDNPGDARLIREMFREQGLPTDGLAHVAGLREAEAHLADRRNASSTRAARRQAR